MPITVAKAVQNKMLAGLAQFLEARGPGEVRFYQRIPGQEEQLLMAVPIEDVRHDVEHAVLTLTPEGSPIRFVGKNVRSTWFQAGEETELDLPGNHPDPRPLTYEIRGFTLRNS